MSQLAEAAGVPVATVKYYLREGLLHEGRRTSATQAHYDDSHVRRLRLVRALVGGAGLGVAAVRSLLAAVDDPPPAAHELLGVAHAAVTPPVGGDVDLTAAHRLLDRWGWGTDGNPATQAALATALAGLAAAELDLPESLLDRYADAMLAIAEAEIAGVPTDSPESAVRYVALGTVLVEPLLLALRRLAEQTASGRRFGAGGLGTEPRTD